MTTTDNRSTADAVAHFAAKLRFETDPSDVAAALAADPDGLVVVDSRNDVAWAQGHLPRAVHLPTAQIRDRAPALLSRDRAVVVYCWGPGCNGATRAALEFARLGYAVAYLLDQAVGVLGQPDAAQPERDVQQRGQLSVEDVLEHDVL